MSKTIVNSLLLISTLSSVISSHANELDDFNKELKNISFKEVMLAKKIKEPEAGWAFKVETMGKAAGARSSLEISEEAKELIIAFEISSRKNYKQKLTHPIWPGNESGMTFGFGYDSGYSTKTAIQTTWKDFLPEDTITGLMTCAGISGPSANVCTNKIKHLVISLDAAEKEFNYYLPFLISQTESTFENYELLSPASRGALASLVYNRGPNTRNVPKRVEMYNISVLMREKKFSEIPAQIRSMTRLWTKPKEKGLIKRRNLEAELFEIGLKQNATH